MKRYIYRFFALLTTVLGAWTFTGCAEDVDTFMTEESGCFNLVVTVPDEAATRATEAEDFNEFKVTKLHLYFYKSADATGPSVYDYVWTGEINNNENNTLTVPLPANALLEGGLFGTAGTECIVYAVANVDEETLPDGPQTIAGLKALGITSTFEQTITQPSFAMDGKSTVTVDRALRRASGEITLERAAAKITLAVSLPDNIVKEGITYTPNFVSMHVWIGNGVKNSKLNTAPVTAEAADLYSNEITTGEGTNPQGTGFNGNGEGDYKYVQKMPFYSYPNKWEATSPDGNCYLTLVLPWYKNGDATQQITTYYRIPVQLKECVIERNMHYDIRVTIGRLGSTDPQEPIDVEAIWNYAIPWNTHGENVDIKQVRYLLLNNNNYDSTITNADGSTTDVYAFDMDNTTDISIPVGTSHDVEIAEVKLTWMDYSINPPTPRPITLTPNSGTYKYNSKKDSYNSRTEFAGIEMDNTKSRLLLKRNMLHIAWERNAATIKTDAAALNSYTFDIKLQHADAPSQTAMVRITQYPAIYITAEETPSGTRFINNNNYTYDYGNNNYKAYVTSNNNMPNSETRKQYYLGSLHNQTEWVQNKNTYIITISRFDADETKNYIIADPRTRSVNNLPASNSYDSQDDVAAWSMADGNNKQLQYYYPADDNSEKERYIAPQIRIASQWGVTYNMTKEGALRRCASYQENGRPAGRWRVPTVAEIEFIANLSCDGYIPYLFGAADDDQFSYWCATGAVRVNNSNKTVTVITSSNTTARSVRCVYDEWYWGNDILTGDAAKKFTWGDRLRSTTSGN